MKIFFSVNAVTDLFSGTVRGTRKNMSKTMNDKSTSYAQEACQAFIKS